MFGFLERAGNSHLESSLKESAGRLTGPRSVALLLCLASGFHVECVRIFQGVLFRMSERRKSCILFWTCSVGKTYHIQAEVCGVELGRGPDPVGAGLRGRCGGSWQDQKQGKDGHPHHLYAALCWECQPIAACCKAVI